jgi:hypothetical protein
MKNIFIILSMFFLLTGCFEQPDITPPQFIPKSPPDSLAETGIDAHSDNAIYLEWEEPVSAESEGILDYYIYRGKLIDQEYQFKRIASVERNAGILFDSDKYVDYDVNLDTTYYYYLKSHNDFTVSQTTSDTAYYKRSYKATLLNPLGDIYSSQPSFGFRYPRFNIDNINYFYLRLAYFENDSYSIKYFIKIFRFDLSRSGFTTYLNSIGSHTTILMDNLPIDTSGKKYLEKGNYRWRVDAIASQLGGAPETEGSESEWMYFTVK